MHAACPASAAVLMRVNRQQDLVERRPHLIAQDVAGDDVICDRPRLLIPAPPRDLQLEAVGLHVDAGGEQADALRTSAANASQRFHRVRVGDDLVFLLPQCGGTVFMNA